MITIDNFYNALENHGFRRKGNSCQCPAHQGTKLSLSVKQSGDTLLLHCHSNGCEFGDILDSLGLKENKGDYEYIPVKKEYIPETPSQFAHKLMQESISDMHYADKSPMLEYLKNRGITDIPFSSDVGFIEKCHYEGNEYQQAIFALLRDRFGNVVTGHRTYIKNGKRYKKRKMMCSVISGISSGAAIRVINSDSDTLIVAEGMETLLSVYVLNGGREANYWSTVSSGGMASLSIPTRFNRIEIYSDLDISLAGQKASQSLADRYDAAIYFPAKKVPKGKKGIDFNDVLTCKVK